MKCLGRRDGAGQKKFSAENFRAFQKTYPSDICRNTQDMIKILASVPQITTKTVKNAYIKANQNIKAPELRVIGADGANLGVMKREEALAKAAEAGLDLIEISPNASPPVAKITEYGKFLYEEEKKRKQAKAKTQSVEIKAVQITIGTGEHDLALKAKRASEWLAEGNRIRVDLFLRGRAKYMDPKFLRERVERILRLITIDYKIADSIKKSPKGMSVMLEKT